jgi:hypothetical protein
MKPLSACDAGPTERALLAKTGYMEDPRHSVSARVGRCGELLAHHLRPVGIGGGPEDDGVSLYRACHRLVPGLPLDWLHGLRQKLEARLSRASAIGRRTFTWRGSALGSPSRFVHYARGGERRNGPKPQ